MGRLQKFLIGLAIVVLGGFAFVKVAYPTTTFRYKLTAEVMTPEGLKSGSSVIEVSYSHRFSLSGVPNLIREVKGEAVFIDLGGGKNFFVTLTSSASGRRANLDPSSPTFRGALGPVNLPITIWNLNWPQGMSGEELVMAKQIEALKGNAPTVVPFVFLPTLVTFRKIDDPDSVEVVQPDGLTDAFGPGYELVKVTLQLTDEPSVEQIEGILPWLKTKKIEWKEVSSLGKGDPLIKRLFYDAFKEPRIWEGTL